MKTKIINRMVIYTENLRAKNVSYSNCKVLAVYSKPSLKNYDSTLSSTSLQLLQITSPYHPVLFLQLKDILLNSLKRF